MRGLDAVHPWLHRPASENIPPAILATVLAAVFTLVGFILRLYERWQQPVAFVVELEADQRRLDGVAVRREPRQAHRANAQGSGQARGRWVPFPRFGAHELAQLALVCHDLVAEHVVVWLALTAVRAAVLAAVVLSLRAATRHFRDSGVVSRREIVTLWVLALRVALDHPRSDRSAAPFGAIEVVPPAWVVANLEVVPLERDTAPAVAEAVGEFSVRCSTAAHPLAPVVLLDEHVAYGAVLAHLCDHGHAGVLLFSISMGFNLLNAHPFRADVMRQLAPLEAPLRRLHLPVPVGDHDALRPVARQKLIGELEADVVTSLAPHVAVLVHDHLFPALGTDYAAADALAQPYLCLELARFVLGDLIGDGLLINLQECAAPVRALEVIRLLLTRLAACRRDESKLELLVDHAAPLKESQGRPQNPPLGWGVRQRVRAALRAVGRELRRVEHCLQRVLAALFAVKMAALCGEAILALIIAHQTRRRLLIRLPLLLLFIPDGFIRGEPRLKLAGALAHPTLAAPPPLPVVVILVVLAGLSLAPRPCADRWAEALDGKLFTRG
mmetsp:Transcript_61703/g.169734  ORF Transcript_61703/g.169734 Transcript_61703/m.169734 type:complete len:556 (-) Transcript_61703:265-1932(-)